MVIAHIRILKPGGGAVWRKYLPSRFRLVANKLAEGFAKFHKFKFDRVPRLEIIVILKKREEKKD